jgi:hypothetical protein
MVGEENNSICTPGQAEAQRAAPLHEREIHRFARNDELVSIVSWYVAGCQD